MAVHNWWSVKSWSTLCACPNSSYQGTFPFFHVTWAHDYFLYLSFPTLGCEDWAKKFPLVTGCGASSKTAYARVVTGVIISGMLAALLTLVVGGVLSAQNGQYVCMSHLPEVLKLEVLGQVITVLA